MIYSLRTILIVLLVIFLDQLSKFLVLRFDFPHTTNQGIAFGLFPFQTLILTLTSLVVPLFFLSRIKKIIRNYQNFISYISIMLIIGGGFSNLFDRVRLGYVVDFIDLKIWPAFNLADAAIVIGALILAWQVIRIKN